MKRIKRDMSTWTTVERRPRATNLLPRMSVRLVLGFLCCFLQVRQAGGMPGEDQYGDPLPDGAVARLGTTRYNIRDAPMAMRWSSDSSLVAIHYHAAIGVVAPGVQILVMATGLDETTPGLDDGEFEDIAWSPDGTKLVTCESSGTLRIWDRGNAWGQRVFVSDAGACECVAWSPDGKTIASGRRADGIQLKDVATGRITGEFAAPASRVAFSNDGKAIAVAGTNRVTVFSLPELQELISRNGDLDRYFSLEFSPDSKFVAASGRKTLRLYSVGSAEKPVEYGMLSGLHSVAFHPKRPLLLTHEFDGLVTIWDMNEKKTLYQENGTQGLGASFSPDGTKWILPRKRLQQVDVESRKIIDRFDAHDRDVLNIVAPDDEKTIVTSGTGPAILQWDLETYRLKNRWTHPENACNLSISPDGETIAVASVQDTAISLIRLSKNQTAILDRHVSPIRCLAFDPTAKNRLMSVSADGQRCLWDTASSDCLKETDGKDVVRINLFHTISASRSGLMAMGLPGAGVIHLIRTEDLEIRNAINIAEPDATFFLPVAISRDGQTVASVGIDEVRQTGFVGLLDSKTGNAIKNIAEVPVMVTAVAISDDSTLLAVSSHESQSHSRAIERIRVYSIASGKLRHEFLGHTGMVRSLRFVSNNRLISASQDATVLVWDVSGKR